MSEKKISLKKTTNNKTKTALIIGGTRGIGFQILKDLTFKLQCMFHI